MGGIIAGFLGGVGQGAAQAGQMMLADKLAKERDEASFLRDSELRKELQKTGFEHDYNKSELESGRAKAAASTKAERDSALQKQKDEAALERTKVTASASSTDTSNIKNLRFLMSAEGGKKSLRDALIASFPNATISHTDAEGNISVAVLSDGGGMESIGSYRLNDSGVPEFVKPGEEPTRTKPTKEEREAKQKEMNKESGADSDWIPFNELSASDKEVKEAAAADLKAKNKPGIVASQSGETKKIGGRDMTKQEFVAAMKKQHGAKATPESIEETWKSIK